MKTFLKEQIRIIVSELSDLGIDGGALKSSHCILAGGAVRNTIIAKEIKDYDFFFTNERSWGELSLKCRDAGIVTDVSSGYSGGNMVEATLPSGRKLQFMYGQKNTTAHKIIMGFDFTVNAVYYSYHEDRLEIAFPQHYKEMTLSLLSITPYTIDRANRFMRLGFTPDSLCRQIIGCLPKGMNQVIQTARRKTPHKDIIYTPHKRLRRVFTPEVEDECTCGAKHTSNPKHHIKGLCDLADE